MRVGEIPRDGANQNECAQGKRTETGTDTRAREMWAVTERSANGELSAFMAPTEDAYACIRGVLVAQRRSVVVPVQNRSVLAVSSIFIIVLSWFAGEDPTWPREGA